MTSLILLLDIAVLLLILAFIFYQLFGNKKEKQRGIKFTYLNEQHRDFLADIYREIDEKESGTAKKKIIKKKKSVTQEDLKKVGKKTKRTFVLKFKGGIFAEEVEKMRNEITAVLLVADPKQDEIVLRLDSPGGTVSGYGLAASQLQRIRDKGVKLTILVDQVAASGGYMMATVANQIIAAPFAYIGSIGVVNEFPNFSKILEKLGVDWKTYTAGEAKRDVGQFGKITPDAEKRLKKKLLEIHDQFKNHIKNYRPKVDIKKIATGEVWTAQDALALKLVDKIQVSDEYVLEQIVASNVYSVTTPENKSRIEKILESVFGVAMSKIKAYWVESQTQKLI